MLALRHAFCALVLLCLPLPAAAEDFDTAPAQFDDGWAVAAPSEAGIDPQALAEMVEKIDTGWIPNVHAVLIEHAGRLVFERYWPGEVWGLDGTLGTVEHDRTTRQDLYSVTKSVTSLLLGIALGGDADTALAHPIASYFPDRDDLGRRLDAVTLHHVLTMTAGLSWNETILPYGDERNDYSRLMTTSDPVGFVLGKPVADLPGRRWTYNSGLTEVTAGVIETVTGKPLTDYADEVLFATLGITDYEWLRPPAWPSESFPSAGAGLQMRARDLAKIGSLVLQNGRWQGRQVVPADWIALSTARHVDHAWDPGDPLGYGYYWFHGTLIDGRSPISGSVVIRAMGTGNQGLLILPEAGLAITVLAGNYDDHSAAVDARIMGLIARALR